MSLTVKWITTHSGIERTRLFQAESFDAFYPDTTDGKMPLMGGGESGAAQLPFKHFDYDLTRNCVFIDAGPNGAGYMLTEGRVYVMNAEGRTVGSYDLGYIQDPGASSVTNSRQR